MNPFHAIAWTLAALTLLGTLVYLGIMGLGIIIGASEQPLQIRFLTHEVLHFVWGGFACGLLWLIIGVTTEHP